MMVAKLAAGPIPLYHQLEQNLVGRISAGEFAGGIPLPTEEQICQTYGVSRITVRKALDSLIQQGLIVRRRGVGSFVAERGPGVHSIHLSGSLDEFLRSAHELTPRVLSLGPVAAPDDVARDFGIAASSPVLRLELVSSSTDGPLADCTFYFPPAVTGVLTVDHITSNEPIVRIVERLMGVRVTRASQVIEPDLAGAVTAAHLGIPADAPVLRTQRSYFTSDNDLIEIAQLRYHPSRYRYEVELRSRLYSV